MGGVFIRILYREELAVQFFSHVPRCNVDSAVRWKSEYHEGLVEHVAVADDGVRWV